MDTATVIREAVIFDVLFPGLQCSAAKIFLAEIITSFQNYKPQLLLVWHSQYFAFFLNLNLHRPYLGVVHHCHVCPEWVLMTDLKKRDEQLTKWLNMKTCNITHSVYTNLGSIASVSLVSWEVMVLVFLIKPLCLDLRMLQMKVFNFGLVLPPT